MSDKFIQLFIRKSAKQRTLTGGTCLFHRDDPVKSVYVIEKGMIELVRYQKNGTSVTLQRATEMEFIAEASVYSDKYHCEASIKQTSVLHEMPKKEFLQLFGNNPDLHNMWSAYLASEIQSARYRSETLSRKTVTERLDCWQDWNNAKLPPKGQWKNIAAQLAISPEALYRELAKRRNGG